MHGVLCCPLSLHVCHGLKSLSCYCCLRECGTGMLRQRLHHLHSTCAIGVQRACTGPEPADVATSCDMQVWLCALQAACWERKCTQAQSGHLPCDGKVMGGAGELSDSCCEPVAFQALPPQPHSATQPARLSAYAQQPK